jgi:flagellar hook-associated protein 2
MSSISSITSSIGAGAGAGFDVAGVVAQLSAIDRQPIAALQSRQDVLNREISALNSINTKLTALQTAANGVAEQSGLDLWQAASSDSSLATATAASGSNAGSLSFKVDRLAGLHTLRSRLVATSPSTSGGATTADRIAVVAGLGKTGISYVRAGSTLASGALAIAVEKASSGAKSSGSAVSSTTVVDGTNNSFTIQIGGSTNTVTIANGTYDRAGLLTALQAAISGSSASGKVTAEMNASNQIELTTVQEGSAASLQITGGTALTALGLGVEASANSGSDGIVAVRGHSTTISDTTQGTSVTLDAGNGETLTATLSGGLRVGGATGSVAMLATGSIQDVVSAINTANVGAKAQTVQTGTSSYRLQLSASVAGEDTKLGVDPAVFDGLGGMVTAQNGQDAQITIGEGSGAFSVTSKTNTFDSVMGGWKITAKSASTTSVTIDVQRDEDGVVKKVKDLIASANDVIAEMKKQTAVSTVKGAASGLLSKDSTVRSVLGRVTSMFTGGGVTGVSVDRNGAIQFDETQFRTAYESDPDTAVKALARGFSSSTSGVNYTGATNATKPGTYAVVLSQVATKATSSAAFVGGAGAAETVIVNRGSASASYTTSSGESAESIRLGLQNALDKAGIALSANLSGGGVNLSSNQWGTGGAFSVRWTTNGSTDTVTGLNAEGTIDGKTATGLGRVLSLPTDSTSGAAGLRVEVTAETTGSHSVTYKAGLTGGIAYGLQSIVQSNTGTMALADANRKSRVKAFTTQMDSMTRRADTREASLRRQYAALDSTIGKMKSQMSALQSQIGSLSSGNGN